MNVPTIVSTESRGVSLSCEQQAGARTGKRRRVEWLFVLLFGFAMSPSVIAQTPFNSNFDHFTTGWPLEGSHRIVDCSRCHVGGIFQGTSRQCSDCHSEAGLVRATPVPPDHIRTTNQCQDCHLETTWAPVWRVDHFQVQGTCGTCHNGSAATGKPSDHIVSGNNCDDCHSTFAWLPAAFDHASVTPGTCNQCHIPDKPADHLVTTAQCDDCHSTVAWLPAMFDHANITSGCTSCHADDKDSGHFVTSDDCAVCHTTNAWFPSVFRHMSAAYPGDHAGNLTCTSCHNGNSATVVWPFPAYQPDCAGCHAGDYKPSVDRHNGLSADSNCGNSGCHSVSSREW